ncbi:MAG: helix-turn-helix domain-containing protein, partial [Acholeplasmatales bacterium]|nr:helix-turn-helix domain-containing protein [Acholeplasmatales bacterium]
MAFCDELKRLRKEKNVSQQTLANNIYVSRSAIAKWENGLGLPSEENIDQLVSYFNVPRENFFPKIEDQELVEKNKTIRKKFKIISTICYFFTLAVIAIFVTYIVVGVNNPYIFNSDKVIA